MQCNTAISGMPFLERQALFRLSMALPIPMPMQCFMQYSTGIARKQQYMRIEPLLAPLTYPERTRGVVTDSLT